jgi:hypothetical protein
MKNPELKDFKLKVAKLINDGGLYVHYSFVHRTNNIGYENDVKITRTLTVHDDLLNILKKQRLNVLKIEQVDPRVLATTLYEMGVDNQKEISQVVDGMVGDQISKIDITGFSFSGSDDKPACVITYKKTMGNKKPVGRSSSKIDLSLNVFGFEEELENDLEEFTAEVYEYLFNDKHGDMEQGKLFPEGEEDPENEDELLKGEPEPEPKKSKSKKKK